MREKEFKKIKELMKEYYEYAKFGFYNTRNIVGDRMFNLYNGKYFQLDLCYEYGYYEVFGATFEEFIKLASYYSKLRKIVGKENDKN